MKLIDRIKTKPGYKILLILGIIILISWIYHLHLKKIKEIKNNPNIIVQCFIKGKGLIDINKSKIEDINDGTFIFTDGYATNCKIIKN